MQIHRACVGAVSSTGNTGTRYSRLRRLVYGYPEDGASMFL